MTTRTPPGGTGLRLALCSDTYLPQVNGVARTLARLVDAVRVEGGDVRVFTTADPGAEPDETVRRSPSIPFWAYPQLQLAAPAPAVLEREMVEWGATLVHAATPFGIGLAARAAARRAGIPFVTSYHTSFSAYARFYRLGALSVPGWKFLRWFHNGGRRTYCPSHAVERELREQGFERIAVWSRGVDAGHFHPRRRSEALRARLGAGPADVVVAYVGRLALEKGLDLAMEGMRLAMARDARLVFVLAGDGPYATECRRAAVPRTTFLGQVVGSALAELYASADLFVFPSTTDTFGNVLLEAMASGTPIVAADAPPTRELLAESGGGVSFRARSASAMAEAVLRLAADADERRRLAVEGRAAAERRSWSAVFEELFADYARVQREHGGTDLPRAVTVARELRPQSTIRDSH